MAAQQHLEPRLKDAPTTVLAAAWEWRQQGCLFPEALLRHAVETALRQDAPWEHAHAAVRFFDLYHDRPWAQTALEGFAASHALDILLNADALAALNHAWTMRAVEVAAAKAPEWVLKALPQVARVDAGWARRFVETLVLTSPSLLFSHVDMLLAVDRAWAQGVLSRVAQLSPWHALQAVGTYIEEPWGKQLFADTALNDPCSTVTLAVSIRPESRAVQQALATATDPHVQLLARLVHSHYENGVKGRMAIFVQDIAAGKLSLDAAARLSASEQAYFRTVAAMRLQRRMERPRAVDFALQEVATTIVQLINELHEQPDAQRFRLAETFTAPDLYLLLTYGDAEIFTSSYRGLFARLLTRMQQEGLTGDQLLARVQDLQFRIFVKSAAFFHRLDAFLATIPAPATRRGLLARCLRDLDREPDMTVQAMIAAEILDTPLDQPSLHLLHETLSSEYQRVEQAGHHEAMAVYGLLAAHMAQKGGSLAPEAHFATLARRYRPYLPDLSHMPLARLFPQDLGVQRYFFYDDEDGQDSFDSFLAQYRHAKAWHVEDHRTFVSIRSRGPGRRIVIYANKPAADDRLDDVDQALARAGLVPGVIVHRGHSYHAAETLDRLPATAAHVFLGSCGSYARLEEVLSKAPEAHIITTKGMASHTVNDPLLKELNDYLLRGKGTLWSDFWRQAAATLSTNPRFAEYVPPDRNSSAIFLIAYRAVTAERLLQPRAQQARRESPSVAATAP